VHVRVAVGCAARVVEGHDDGGLAAAGVVVVRLGGGARREAVEGALEEDDARAAGAAAAGAALVAEDGEDCRVERGEGEGGAEGEDAAEGLPPAEAESVSIDTVGGGLYVYAENGTELRCLSMCGQLFDSHSLEFASNTDWNNSVICFGI
jgi:hypothetical protein